MCVQVCVFKAMGDTKRQAEELNALLRQFPADSAAWLELGDLYLSLCDMTVCGASIFPLFSPMLDPEGLNDPYHIRTGCCSLFRGIGVAESGVFSPPRTVGRSLLLAG